MTLKSFINFKQLNDEAAIAVTEKTKLFLNRFSVSFFHKICPRQSTYQHEEGALWQVKIG